MPNLSWLTQDHVIYTTLPDVLSAEFMGTLDQQVSAVLNEASHPIHFVMDASAVKSFPSPKAALNISYYAHPNLGKLIVFGLKSNPFLSFLSTLVSHTAGVKIKIFETMQEVDAYLAALRVAE